MTTASTSMCFAARPRGVLSSLMVRPRSESTSAELEDLEAVVPREVLLDLFTAVLQGFGVVHGTLDADQRVVRGPHHLPLTARVEVVHDLRRHVLRRPTGGHQAEVWVLAHERDGFVVPRVTDVRPDDLQLGEGQQ